LISMVIDRMLQVLTEENLCEMLVTLLLDGHAALEPSTDSLTETGKEKEKESGSGQHVEDPLTSENYGGRLSLTDQTAELMTGNSRYTPLINGFAGQSVKKILFERLNDPDENVQVATWRLFYTLVSIHYRYSVPLLLPQTLGNLNDFEISKKTGRTHAEEIQKYLELLPAPSNNYEVFGYENYLLDIEDIVTSIHPTDARRKASLQEGHKNKSRNLQNKASKEKGKQKESSLENESGISSRQSSIMSKSSEDQILDPLSSNLKKETEPDIFLEMLLGRLDNFLTNPFDSNILITGIMTQLACYPDIRLTEFILHSDSLFNRYLMSLYTILLRTSHEIIRSLEGSELRRENLELIRNLLEPGSQKTKYPAIPLGKEEENELKNIIVFEEFIKEIAAVMQVQLLAGNSLVINYMD